MWFNRFPIHKLPNARNFQKKTYNKKKETIIIIKNLFIYFVRNKYWTPLFDETKQSTNMPDRICRKNVATLFEKQKISLKKFQKLSWKLNILIRSFKIYGKIIWFRISNTKIWV